MTYGENASYGIPGYKKALTGAYLPELYNAPAPAPPEAEGLPWTLGGYEYNPLIEDRPSPPPPKPDRGVKAMGRCKACGSSFLGFNETDAAACPNCGDALSTVSGLTAPGTPWF